MGGVVFDLGPEIEKSTDLNEITIGTTIDNSWWNIDDHFFKKIDIFFSVFYTN